MTEKTATELTDTTTKSKWYHAVEAAVGSFHRVRKSVIEAANAAQKVVAVTDGYAERSIRLCK